MKRIGIYGGSFNPIHRGHIELGNFICSHNYVDELWFMVSPLNPFKKQNDDLLEDKARLELAELAVAPYPHLKVSDFEFHLERPSYMYKTLDALRQTYPDMEFVLIIGADNWIAFDRWARASYLLEQYRILIFPRSGADVQEDQLPETVQLIPSPLIDLSATDIRKRIQEGKDVTKDLPEAVWQKIREKGYYRL